MKCFRSCLVFFTLLAVIYCHAQQATIVGVVTDTANKGIPGVSIKSGTSGTATDSTGAFRIQIPAETPVEIIFSHISFQDIRVSLTLSLGEVYLFNPVMTPDVQQIGEIVLTRSGEKTVKGIQTLSPQAVKMIPGANAGVENVLRTLPGVNFNNELSTQYNVRGGNFDENLVYVNGFEIYRPLLIRSGQQEGLSFINTALVDNISFSAGGFEARYGDKLSSVLAVDYRKPTKFGAGLEASLLGAGAWVQGSSINNRLKALGGIRYRDNSLFVNSKETETNFRPVFADAQLALSYDHSERWQWNFLGHLSLNQYNYRPLTRQTNFGTLQDPMALLVFYRGNEQDEYSTQFGAINSIYKAAAGLELTFSASAYHTTEQEYYDILAQYRLGEVNSDLGSEDLGEVVFSEGIGSQLTHARNLLDALILTLEHRGKSVVAKGLLQWGLRYSREDFRDKLEEYEVIDSAGFSIRPPLPEFANDQPYSPYTAPLTAFSEIRAKNFVTTDRFSGFAQWSRDWNLGSGLLYANAGVRMQHWRSSPRDSESQAQTIVSPRVQLAYQPGNSPDLVFRLAGGLYQQPPFYREMRDLNGVLIPEVKAQKAWHVSGAGDMSFKMWDRPFKFSSEIYYRNLSRVNTYTLENVRLRYRANNEATAYAYGLDLRINGEFVPGTESWFSAGYLKTEENQDNRGYISRPTDQRLKFAVLFQDYIPSIPQVKLYLNGVYNTGVPGGSPNYADPYNYQFRLPSYKRLDVGIFYVFTDAKRRYPKGHWLHKFKELSTGFEIFNIFDIQNSITNTWVRDVYTKRQFAVPNYMTPRLFNVKFRMQL